LPHCWKSLDDLEPDLRRFLSMRSHDEAEIDDVLQETYLRAARFRLSLKDPKHLRAWAFRIASNVLTDRIRRNARYCSVSEGEPWLDEVAIEAAEAEALDSVMVDGRSEPRGDVLEVLVGALKQLRSRDRDLIESFYGGAGSCRETAESCSVSEGAVKVRLYRVRGQLREAVTQEVTRKRREVASSKEVR